MKKLYLSNEDRKIAGVCGGIGDYFGIDSTLIRLIFLAITILTGLVPGFIIYIVAWIVMPELPIHEGSRVHENE